MPTVSRKTNSPKVIAGNNLSSRRAAATQARSSGEIVKPRSARAAAPVPVEEDENDLPFGEDDLVGKASPVVEEDEDEDGDSVEDEDDEDEDEEGEEDEDEEGDDGEDDEDAEADEDDELDEDEDDEDSVFENVEDEDNEEADDEEEVEPEPEPTPKVRGRKSTAPVVEAQPTKASSKRVKEDEAPVVQRPTRATALAIPLKPRNRMMTAEDMLMPKLKAAQGLSQVVINRQVDLGNWYITGRNESLGDTVFIIPVDMSMSRSIFVNGKGVICHSYDLVQGIGDPGILCEGTEEEIEDPTIRNEDRGCEMRLWITDKSGQRTPPPCQKAYNYPILLLTPPDSDADEFDLEDAVVRQSILSMRSTWSGAARGLNTLVMSAPDPTWHMNVFQLQLTQRNGAKGTSLVPIVEHIGETPEKLIPRALEYARLVSSNQFIRANLESMDDDE